VPGSEKTARKPGAIVSACDDMLANFCQRHTARNEMKDRRTRLYKQLIEQ
jgi:hypothetical protein